MQAEKRVFGWVMAISILVFIAVVVLNQQVLPKPDPMPGFPQKPYSHFARA
jgi:hypothetical protein